MEEIENFQIALETDVCRTGSSVSGSVKIKIAQPVETKEIRLEIEGKATTEFMELRSFEIDCWNSDIYRAKLAASENYIDWKIHLWPDSTTLQQNQNSIIPAGDYDFPFSFQIPENCPSSFIGEYGRIVYFCKAVIDPLQENSDPKICMVPFTVVSLVDLNIWKPNPALSHIQESKSKKVGRFFCLFSGNHKCDVDIPQSGFVSGESIPLNFTISNNSHVLVIKTKVKLVEKVTYDGNIVLNKASEKYPQSVLYQKSKKHTRRTLVKLLGDGIKHGGSQNWQGRYLTIPPICATMTSKSCSFISLSYELLIQIYRRKWICFKASLNVYVPILIGNVPLRVSYNRNDPTDQTTVSDQHDDNERVGLLAAAYPDQPCPTYEENKTMSVGVRIFRNENNLKKNTKNPLSAMDFAPRYPYYGCLNKPDH